MGEKQATILHPAETKFENKWETGDMKPTTLKLLHQQPVSKMEWQNLFWDVHHVCSWDDSGSKKLFDALQRLILSFISECQQRVLGHLDDQALLRAYINEWGKFFAQCQYLPKPYTMLVPQNIKQGQSATAGQAGGAQEKPKDGILVEKLMLDSWNESIFSAIKDRLQDSAMKLVQGERSGEGFDTQLVIGVRESYVNLSSDADDHLKIYRENFESAYLAATTMFYKEQASQHLAENGVRNYMNYAAEKLREEDQRAMRYLETSKESNSLQKVRVGIFYFYYCLPVCLPACLSDDL
jgi:cullin-5